MVQKAKEEKTERTPEAWLKDITELRRDGKLKEALEELEKFRKRFPGYALPPELKDLR
jgi:outer membrane protein assembly factor BamD (BamD/ComL family)